MNHDHDQHPAPEAAATRRTVHLTTRWPEQRPNPDPDQAAERLTHERAADLEDLWTQRRRAGHRLFALTALAVAGQFLGLLLADGHPVLQSALLAAPYPALMLAAGLLAPRPPAGFFRSQHASHPTAGVDAFTAAVIAANLIPQQLLSFCLPDELGINATVATILTSFGLGAILLLTALGLREHHHRHAARRHPERDQATTAPDAT